MKICIAGQPSTTVQLKILEGVAIVTKDPAPNYTAPSVPDRGEMVLTYATAPIPVRPRYLNRAERRKLKIKYGD